MLGNLDVLFVILFNAAIIDSLFKQMGIVMKPTFRELRKLYPTQAKGSLFDKMGGEWPSLKTNSNYDNTCTIRLSVALNSSETPIPEKFKEAIDGQGKSIVLKVKTFSKYLSETYSQSYWGISKQPGQDIDSSHLPNVSGIIVYHANFLHATGHFDLWTGQEFVGAGNFDDIKVGYSLELWKVD